jgi:outer membrane protein TolC
MPQAYEGPPLSLADAIAEALSKNPDLLALRAQLPLARARPAQERALAPPMLEGSIWQWPINTLNPANTNMFMLMVSQDIPGRGKRDLRAAVAEKDIALAESDVTIRARQVLNDVKQAYTSLFIARAAIDVHSSSIDLLRQMADAAQAKYTTGRISQQDVLKPVVELSRHHGDIIMFNEQAHLATARLNILRTSNCCCRRRPIFSDSRSSISRHFRKHIWRFSAPKPNSPRRGASTNQTSPSKVAI